MTMNFSARSRRSTDSSPTCSPSWEEPDVDAVTVFPPYIPRAQEHALRREALRVQRSKNSRAVMLYGEGGIGKTWLVRQLAHRSTDESISWVEPIDVDDPDYWLLSNLEQRIAADLDPQNAYFGEYLDYVSRLPTSARHRVRHETVVTHLGRIKHVFEECYTHFVKDTGKTVVMTFDTVETIRSVYLLYTITQWMKALPGTLFVLSGRPPGSTETDPIRSELEDPHQRMPVSTIHLTEFTQKAAREYLVGSSVAASLSPSEVEKIILLTRGHPLWLAFTISYLGEKGLPEEARASLPAIRREMPYKGPLSSAGQLRLEGFKRRLVTPYREVDFWHEAIKRLAVARQSMNATIWQRLMSDRPLPEDTADPDAAWEMLLRTPWIRTRANRRQVTLHDAVAEELGRRIIPLHDKDRRWRRQVWERAGEIYGEFTREPQAKLEHSLTELDHELLALDERRLRAAQERRLLTSEERTSERAVIDEAARLDARKRELDQMRVVQIYYRFLCDFGAGSQAFLQLFDAAKRGHNVFLQDRLALEILRFLPGSVEALPSDDIIGSLVDEFREWLHEAGSDWYLQLGATVADHLIETEKAETAMQLLEQLPQADNAEQRFRIHILKGNACMRVPGRTGEGRPHFLAALAEAEASTAADRQHKIAEAHKELGFYYRNQGLWLDADAAYRTARDVISAERSAMVSAEDREEMASIQTNWAYVKGLLGNYLDGSNLVESAITVRRRLGRPAAEASSWSVRGELHRFERRFDKAWEAYAEAERLFQEQRDWPWLGLVFQQQAICLLQAHRTGVVMAPDEDPMAMARRLITRALDICHDQNPRGYPSALNRAGRIFGEDDIDTGLDYLEEGIDQARRLSDGWFRCANLVEFAELCYRGWRKTRARHYLDKITERTPEVHEVIAEYEFPDLEGRWGLLQGQLSVDAWRRSRDAATLAVAQRHYEQGFALMARGYVGSSGASAVPDYFQKFASVLSGLSAETRTAWLAKLRSSWSGLEQGSTLLLARLEELY
jgi:tetratricopeptide (TPR) repeat protein/GTPase SAR1 family protein